jgi:hypothetical protein
VLVLALGVARAEPGEAPHLAKVTPPAARVSVDEAVRTAVDFLVKNQNKDGSFGRAAHERTYQLWCDVPGGHMAFRAATTALCWMGLNDAPYQPEASKQAQARCLAWLAKNARVKRAYSQQFYNIWALCRPCSRTSTRSRRWTAAGATSTSGGRCAASRWRATRSRRRR